MGMSQQEPFVAPGELMEDEFNIQLIISVICVDRAWTRGLPADKWKGERDFIIASKITGKVGAKIQGR